MSASLVLGHLSNKQSESRTQQTLVGRYSIGVLKTDRQSHPTLKISLSLYAEFVVDGERLRCPRQPSGVLWPLASVSYPRTYRELCESWISRARTTPLSFRLQDDKWDRLPAGPIASLLRTIVGSGRRWRKMDLDVGHHVAEFIFLALEKPFPLLEELLIRRHHTGLPMLFSDAPKLCNVAINYPGWPQAPWHQLTTVRAYDIPLHSCFEILHKSLYLEDATFEVRGDGLITLPTSIFQHDHLQRLSLGASLSVRGSRARDMPMPILEHLATPVLRTLALQFVDWSTRHHNVGPVSPLLSFLPRSPQLHTLEISCMPTTMNGLIQCLQAAPSLVELKLEPVASVFNINPLFVQLTGNNDFLPRLEHLSLIFPRLTAEIIPKTLIVTPLVVVNMLCWRWGTMRLKSFRFAHPPKQSAALGQAIKSNAEFIRLERAGMVLYVGPTDNNDTFL
ncbi:hypothetical protein B0H16DRAFT_1717048 [Mycena metata]|uniref:F-box domain-containing protein n=1 Tax=Mycena metata TaxID=1033252 RepID=A0AAD7JMY3_9AGAR|nr:hypothetical protein B0H16DRAFT_1717048 [Mycena metata]